ncbi:hypothetical protein HA1_05522 [Clostridium perfringens F262]|uniref:Uncharacterized protein n=1 Tax=Clostridium perfringens F262 TaxID=883064 RepID=A0AAV3FEH4_CLOPF|nr:hypothetical protein HA1_05522 [Clostridium perfringens F262]
MKFLIILVLWSLIAKSYLALFKVASKADKELSRLY